MLAGVLALGGVIIGLLVIPWDASVAPWAVLDLPTIADFTDADVAAISNYADAVWLPSLLGWLAGPIAAVLLLAIGSVRRRLTSLGPAGRPFLGDVITAAVVLTVVRFAALPFTLWAAQVRRDAGLLISPWWSDLFRWALESVAYIGFGALAAALGMAVLRRWPRRGWVGVVAAAMAVAALVSALVPLAQRVEGTRADPALTARVMALAQSLGVDVGSVAVIETGDRSPALNANVSGWGPTRAVTLFDTVTGAASPAEIDALVAHELVHVRENDVVLGTVLAVLGAGIILAIGFSLILAPSVRQRIGARDLADRPVLLVLIATVLVGTLLGTVAASNVSRHLEARADREAVAATGDVTAYRDLMIRLAVTNKSSLEPSRSLYALLYTHPTPLQRLAALDVDSNE